LAKCIADRLKQVCRQSDKAVEAEFLFGLTADQLQSYISQSLLADGTCNKQRHHAMGHSERQKGDKSETIAQVSEARIRAFELACVLAGKPVMTHQRTYRGKTYWETTLLACGSVSPVRNASKRGRAKYERVPYEGVVWCPQTDLGNWVCRRNGSVHLTGNTEIVRDFCLWGGFMDPRFEGGSVEGGGAYAHGTLEFTGTYHKESLRADLFDKKPLLECINTIREIVGFHFWTDEDGAVQFRMPNWYTAGNFYDDGERTNYVPEIDEKLQLTSYTVTFSDRNINSEIFVGSEAPDEKGNFTNTKVTRFVPPSATLMRGINKPFAYLHPALSDVKDQRVMAELIALHSFFRLRQGSVTIAALPILQIDDQVRISERVTGDTYIHYVRGISSSHDLDTGEWTQTLTTNWLGENADWVLQSVGANKAVSRGGAPPSPYRFPLSAELVAYLKELQSRTVQVSRGQP
jgi:hypothetical protein